MPPASDIIFDMDLMDIKPLFGSNSYQIAITLIANVYDKESVKEFDADWHSPQQRFLGIWNNNVLIGLGGYALSPATNRIIELNWAAILPEYRGQGLGRQLLDARLRLSMEEAKKNNAPLEGWIVHSLPTSLYLSKGGIKLLKTTEGKYLIFMPFQGK